MPAMGEYASVGSQGSGMAGGSQGNIFADVTSSVISSLGDLADRVLALPPLMLVVIVVVFVLGGLMVFRRV